LFKRHRVQLIQITVLVLLNDELNIFGAIKLLKAPVAGLHIAPVAGMCGNLSHATLCHMRQYATLTHA